MQKENNKKISLIIVGIVVLAGVFYGGMIYGKSKIPVRSQGMQVFGQNSIVGARGTRNMGGGGFTNGEIIAKDDKSITVKLTDGGSKIIFLDANTKVSKQATGTTSDLTAGTEVSITGTANSDGSINAQSVQIRPSTAPVLK